MSDSPPSTSDPETPPHSLAAGLLLALGDDPRGLEDTLTALDAAGSSATVRTLLRVGLLQTGRSMMWYTKLLHRWEDLGRPALKPNPVSRRIVFLADHTVDFVLPLARGFCASLGIDAVFDLRTFDSIESEILDANSTLHADPGDLTLIALGEDWLCRQLGPPGPIPTERVTRATEMLDHLVNSVVEHSETLVTNFAPDVIPAPGGYAHGEGRIGYTAAIGQLNSHLYAMQSQRMTVIDQAQAVHAAGGRHAYCMTNKTRAGVPFAPACLVTLAREIAFTIAALSGKTHRALVTDLDNTLWGGIIGDAGPHGIVSGPDDPEGQGYYRLQQYCRRLTSLGVALAAASKNEPDVKSIFEDNPNVALTIDDFSSMQIGWDPKSNSITRISEEMGFGPEFLLFVDDNPFELAEALGRHPDLDVILAAPDPSDTLALLADGRYFHTVRITDTDLSRQRHQTARQAAAAMRTSFDDYEAYLAAIEVRIDVHPYGEPNRRRVVQMLQKSNQFNLTTRRHTELDLDTLIDEGATIGVFSYEDVFGSQGVIAAVVLVPEGDRLRIDSWVMSCRVLNRTVEQAIGAWMMQRDGARPLLGEFIASDKNALVRDLYDRLGFRRVVSSAPGDHVWWECDPSADTPPTHLVELRTDSWDQHDEQEQDRRDRDRRLSDAVSPTRSRAA